MKGCNIKCGYCVRKHDCANENRPGIASRILSPREAVERVREAVADEPRITVVGIAGPGDPLHSPATFETLKLVRDEFPQLKTCLSTNGLLLPEKIGELGDLGLSALTVTVNAIDPAVGSRIYSHVRWKGRLLRGTEAFSVLTENQLAGIREAVKRGIVVKVNSVCIPGINAEHLPAVARAARSLGAYVMNVMPLIPQGEFANMRSPTAEEIIGIRDACEGTIFQFRHCTQCRADAVGIPGAQGCSRTAYAV